MKEMWKGRERFRKWQTGPEKQLQEILEGGGGKVTRVCKKEKLRLVCAVQEVGKYIYFNGVFFFFLTTDKSVQPYQNKM